MNFKGIRDLTIPKRFCLPILKSQFCIKKKEEKNNDYSSGATLFDWQKFSTKFQKRVIAKTNKTKSDIYKWTPPPAKPAKFLQSTSTSISLGHVFADTDPSIPNMKSEAFYLLPCRHSSSCCSCSCCYLQPPAKIAARCRYRPPITNLTANSNSKFCLSFHFSFTRKLKKRLQTCLNGAWT